MAVLFDMQSSLVRRFLVRLPVAKNHVLHRDVFEHGTHEIPKEWQHIKVKMMVKMMSHGILDRILDTLW